MMYSSDSIDSFSSSPEQLAHAAMILLLASGLTTTDIISLAGLDPTSTTAYIAPDWNFSSLNSVGPSPISSEATDVFFPFDTSTTILNPQVSPPALQKHVVPARRKEGWAQHHYTCDMVSGFIQVEQLRSGKPNHKSGDTFFEAAFPDDRWVKATFNKHYAIYQKARNSEILLKYQDYGRVPGAL
ncbi:hypothetical protein C8J56DRAFT_1060585 [Mycena floridula]|nr:hypothetical protein C8J56DRAFT_1060585 [Mycena floridula]